MGGLGFEALGEEKDELRDGLLEAPCMDDDATELVGGLLKAWRWEWGWAEHMRWLTSLGGRRL